MPGPGGRVVDVTPTAMVAGGDAIARDADGRVVFVDGGLPGERVTVEVVSPRRSYAMARVVEVLEPSLDRIPAPCPEVERGCGACQWQHITVDAQQRFKADIVRDAIRRLGGFEPPAFAPTVTLAPWAFRTTVRAAVVKGRAGFRRAHSHDVVAVDGCLVAHPLLTELIVDGRYRGAGEVLLRCGARTGERLAAATPRRAAVTVPDDVRSDHLHELAVGRSWRISARSFFQSRVDGVDALAAVVANAADELGVARTAIDLYSGVGVFAGVLAARGWSVTAVESARSAVADTRVNLRGLTVEVVRADVTQWTAPHAELVVADPTRAGLGRHGVDAIEASGARRAILVSCDAASLGRDAGLLSRAGYDLTAVTPVDLFPQTAHVEVVTVFDRRASNAPASDAC
jgi:23S rRNA (uracil1939-C5)-methyltransferase